MNAANRLTLSRIFMIPVFVIFMLVWSIPMNIMWALVVFVTASLTDWLDGFVARRFNMITDLGKFLDPLADKILVISALICFVELRWIPVWTVLVIVAREFIVTGFRLAVVQKDNTAVIAADVWGKVKTSFTMLVIIAILALQAMVSVTAEDARAESLELALKWWDVNYILMIVVAVFTVVSGLSMILGNKYIFRKRDNDGQQ